jgi:two-component system, chemotaxis family, protein-glutamate methylesterase/glutaminase
MRAFASDRICGLIGGSQVYTEHEGKNEGNEMHQPSRKPDAPGIIGIVSSTGGFDALVEVLGSLPREFPVPILVVPSINPIYVNWLAARLDAKGPLHVTVAKDGQVPEPGSVYVATDDPCLIIVDCRLRLEGGNPDYKRRPKDALFRSMARDQKSGAIAVILTGMGMDGAEGMKEVRDAGGYTIVQDESTSVVYGGRYAVELKAACESLPIRAIAPRLVALVDTGLLGPSARKSWPNSSGDQGPNE